MNKKQLIVAWGDSLCLTGIRLLNALSVTVKTQGLLSRIMRSQSMSAMSVVVGLR
jgi:hypothetical protein